MKHIAQIQKEFVKKASDADVICNYQRLLHESKKDIMELSQKVPSLKKELLAQLIKTAIENHLNIYEGICALYNKRLIDRDLVETLFKSCILKLSRDPNFQEKLNDSDYSQIKLACQEWS